VRAEDLTLSTLLDVEGAHGLLTFAGERTLLFDAVALGLLRKELIDTFGATAARGVLTRFGYAHGWRTAETLRTALPWDSEREWRIAGGRLHELHGMVVVEPPPRTPGAGPEPFAEALWRQSYEAEQHLLHLGRADEPICWTLCGFASGYLSYANGREIYFLESRCRGRGDAVCHVVGKPASEWGDELAPHLPFYRQKCLDASLERVTRALKRTEKRLASRRRRLVEGGAGHAGAAPQSEAMRGVLELCERAARVDAMVLVTGPAGSGKEWLARRLHESSPRAGGPFVVVRCGAGEALLERELFGGAEGSAFIAARGGTVVIDEVGELPAALQARLVAVLDGRLGRAAGRSDVRLVATSRRDLGALAAAGRFDPELLARLRVLELKLPVLAERREDLLPLAALFAAEASRRAGRRLRGIAPSAAAHLVAYDWPGNVRELENALERAVAVTAGPQVEVCDLPPEVRAYAPAPRPVDGVRTLAEVEREYVLAALARNHGNRARTAEQLGIGEATLYRKLKVWSGPSGACA
jgi:DNA-binding NtrC family response regulator